MCTSFTSCLTKNNKGGFCRAPLTAFLSSDTGRQQHTPPARSAGRSRWRQRCRDNGDFAAPSRRQRSVVARSLDDLRGCSCEHIPQHGTTADGLPGTHRHRHAAVSARPCPAIQQVVSTDDRSGPHHALGQAGCGSLRASLHQPSGPSCHGSPGIVNPFVEGEGLDGIPPRQHVLPERPTATPSAACSTHHQVALSGTAHLHTSAAPAGALTAHRPVGLTPPPRKSSNTHPVPASQHPHALSDANALTQHPVTTPVNIDALEQELSSHPDRPFVLSLLSSLRHGADIGYRGPRRDLIAPNLPLARKFPEHITAALDKEVSLGRMAGPFHDTPYSPLHCSGLGSVEKSDGSRRMIMHLSAPRGRSVNDSIDRSAFTLSYITLDDAAALVARHGKGALMSKVDLKSAFRLIPVRPQRLGTPRLLLASVVLRRPATPVWPPFSPCHFQSAR